MRTAVPPAAHGPMASRCNLLPRTVQKRGAGMKLSLVIFAEACKAGDDSLRHLQALQISALDQAEKGLSLSIRRNNRPSLVFAVHDVTCGNTFPTGDSIGTLPIINSVKTILAA